MTTDEVNIDPVAIVEAYSALMHLDNRHNQLEYETRRLTGGVDFKDYVRYVSRPELFRTGKIHSAVGDLILCNRIDGADPLHMGMLIGFHASRPQARRRYERYTYDNTVLSAVHTLQETSAQVDITKSFKNYHHPITKLFFETTRYTSPYIGEEGQCKFDLGYFAMLGVGYQCLTSVDTQIVTVDATYEVASEILLQELQYS